MKRKVALRLLPLALFALMLGVKWRANHPTPTKLDLKLRAMMSQSEASRVSVVYYPFNPKKDKRQSIDISPQESEKLIECFYLSPHPNTKSLENMGADGQFLVTYFHEEQGKPLEVSTSTGINIRAREGRVISGRLNTHQEFVLHPITVKRWIEILLANPRIGPGLRARIKS